MKFGHVKRMSDPELVISPRHEEWMASNSNPTYSEEALDFAREQMLLQASPRDRRGTFSASSVNTCKRKQQFTFLGMPQAAPTPKLAGIFQNGTFTHIRWQMAGLTEGWLVRGEVPVPKNNALGLSGTQDGVCDDGSILEVKSINTNGFSRVTAFGPKEDHLGQGATYAAVTGAEKVVFLYEDKNTQEYREIVKRREDLPIEMVVRRAGELWESVDKQQLFEPLEGCIDRTGMQYRNCPYSAQCLGINEWSEVHE